MLQVLQAVCDELLYFSIEQIQQILAETRLERSTRSILVLVSHMLEPDINETQSVVSELMLMAEQLRSDAEIEDGPMPVLLEGCEDAELDEDMERTQDAFPVDADDEEEEVQGAPMETASEEGVDVSGASGCTMPEGTAWLTKQELKEVIHS